MIFHSMQIVSFIYLFIYLFEGTGMTLRDGMGREVGGGFRMGKHMYTHGWFMSMYGKNHYNIVK